MQRLVMYDTEEDLLALTGLPNRDALWDAGFNLDDWDVGFVYETEIEEGWLRLQMGCYCVGSLCVAYDGKYYYMVYHA